MAATNWDKRKKHALYQLHNLLDYEQGGKPLENPLFGHCGDLIVDLKSFGLSSEAWFCPTIG